MSQELATKCRCWWACRKTSSRLSRPLRVETLTSVCTLSKPAHGHQLTLAHFKTLPSLTTVLAFYEFDSVPCDFAFEAQVAVGRVFQDYQQQAACVQSFGVVLQAAGPRVAQGFLLPRWSYGWSCQFDTYGELPAKGQYWTNQHDQGRSPTLPRRQRTYLRSQGEHLFGIICLAKVIYCIRILTRHLLSMSTIL